MLMSFNNKPAKDAIPSFEELIVPLSSLLTGIGKDGGNSGNNGNNNGTAGTDQAAALRALLTDTRIAVDSALKSYAESSLAPRFVEVELLPLLSQGLEVLDQVPALLSYIARGSKSGGAGASTSASGDSISSSSSSSEKPALREFDPSPSDTKEVCRRMYRARRTLLLKFEDDTLDESLAIETTLREANTIMRMKRPMVEMEVELRILQGTHITPLAQTLLPPPPPDGLRDALEQIGVPGGLYEQGIYDPLSGLRSQLRKSKPSNSSKPSSKSSESGSGSGSNEAQEKSKSKSKSKSLEEEVGEGGFGFLAGELSAANPLNDVNGVRDAIVEFLDSSLNLAPLRNSGD